MAQLEKSQLHLGYIPLLDCVPLLWAKQRGFFEEVGLDVSLVKEAVLGKLKRSFGFWFPRRRALLICHVACCRTRSRSTRYSATNPSRLKLQQCFYQLKPKTMLRA